MKVIKPIPIAAHLVSSTATESAVEFDMVASYPEGAQVYVAADKRAYTSLQAGNAGHAPAASPLWWVDTGPMNKWAMFDDEVSTQTTGHGTITVVIDPGNIDSVALFNVSGSVLQIDVTNGPTGPNVGSLTVDLDGSIVTDWAQYFFEVPERLSEVVRQGLPSYSAARLTLTITGPGTVGIGTMVLGTAYNIGDTQFGASVGITDYSRVQTDEFGVTRITRRRTAKTMDARMEVRTANINKVSRVLSDVASVPAVYVGGDGDAYAPLVIFGLGTFRVEIASPLISYCSLEVKGLT